MLISSTIELRIITEFEKIQYFDCNGKNNKNDRDTKHTKNVIDRQ